MVTYNTSNIKNGLKVLINNEPHVIIESEFYKPGKGQAFSKLKVKNLINGKTNEKTLKIGESLEHADIKEKEMQFLYNDNTGWIFMDGIISESEKSALNALDFTVFTAEYGKDIKAKDFKEVLTSGEIIWQKLYNKSDPYFKKLGK